MVEGSPTLPWDPSFPLPQFHFPTFPPFHLPAMALGLERLLQNSLLRVGRRPPARLSPWGLLCAGRYFRGAVEQESPLSSSLQFVEASENHNAKLLPRIPPLPMYRVSLRLWVTQMRNWFEHLRRGGFYSLPASGQIAKSMSEGGFREVYRRVPKGGWK
jgi:hypothetical protein